MARAGSARRRSWPCSTTRHATSWARPRYAPPHVSHISRSNLTAIFAQSPRNLPNSARPRRAPATARNLHIIFPHEQVFFRAFLLEALEQRRGTALAVYAVVVQKNLRGALPILLLNDS